MSQIDIIVHWCFQGKTNKYLIWRISGRLLKLKLLKTYFVNFLSWKGEKKVCFNNQMLLLLIWDEECENHMDRNIHKDEMWRIHKLRQEHVYSILSQPLMFTTFQPCCICEFCFTDTKLESYSKFNWHDQDHQYADTEPWCTSSCESWWEV